MAFDGGRVPARRPRLLGPALTALGLLAACAGPAAAQEPLLLRIRPLPEPGSAEAARAAREALWVRRQAHARAVIAAVCTGCLGAWTPPAAAPSDPAPLRAADRVAALAEPAGLATELGSGASEPAPEPPTSERRTSEPPTPERLP